jgi:hypothetical protein
MKRSSTSFSTFSSFLYNLAFSVPKVIFAAFNIQCKMEFYAHTFNVIFLLSPSPGYCRTYARSPHPLALAHREGRDDTLPATAHGATPSAARRHHLGPVGDVPRHRRRALSPTTRF